MNTRTGRTKNPGKSSECARTTSKFVVRVKLEDLPGQMPGQRKTSLSEQKSKSPDKSARTTNFLFCPSARTNARTNIPKGIVLSTPGVCTHPPGQGRCLRPLFRDGARIHNQHRTREKRKRESFYENRIFPSNGKNSYDNSTGASGQNCKR